MGSSLHSPRTLLQVPVVGFPLRTALVFSVLFSFFFNCEKLHHKFVNQAFRRHIGNSWSDVRPARHEITIYNSNVPVMYIHSRKEKKRGLRRENFLSPSPAFGILYFYWTFEMVRAWSSVMLDQWHVVLRKQREGKVL